MNPAPTPAHTPLQSCCGDKPDSCGYIFTADGGAYVAKMLKLDDDVDPVLSDAERERYRRLFIASPALLAALEAYVEALKDGPENLSLRRAEELEEIATTALAAAKAKQV